MESEGIVNGRLPKLTMKNWNTEFREAFLDFTLNYPDAAIILQTGVDRGIDGDTREPHPDQMAMIEDPDNPNGPMIEGDQARYANNQLGYARFQRDEKRFREIREAKMKVISKLLSSMERDIRDKVEAAQGFQQAIRTANLIEVWNLTEQVVQGVGAISIYALTSRFMRMRQKGPEDWAHYAKEWRTVVTDLLRLGNHQQVLEAIFNTHLVLTVDQTQFKEKLTPIYGTNQWPDYAALLDELTTYAGNRERLDRIEQEAKTDTANQAYYKNTMPNSEGCWNCGSTDHIRANCPHKPKRYEQDRRPRTQTGNTRDNYHENKMIRNRRTGEEENTPRRMMNTKTTSPPPRRSPTSHMQRSSAREPAAKKPSRTLQKNPKDGRRPSNKTLNRKRVIKKALGYLTSQLEEDDDDDNEDYDEEEEEHIDMYYEDEDDEDCNNEQQMTANHQDYYHDEEDDDDDYDYEELYTCTEIVIPSDEEEEHEEVFKTTPQQDEEEEQYCHQDPSEIEFILDTGCRSHNICRSKQYMTKMKPTNIKIKGINGGLTKARKLGELPIVGDTLFVPEADANLISVRQVLAKYQGRIQADNDHFTIMDKHNNVILQGRMKGRTGFWTCTMEDLLKLQSANYPVVSTEEESIHTMQQTEQQSTNTPAVEMQQQHYTAEERKRALEAWRLCAKLGHPGFDTIMRDLDCGVHPDSMLTSRDVKNAIALHGPCAQCLEAKMRAPPEPTSQSEPAHLVGQHLHADLIPMHHRSIGGNTVILVAIDEKSSYITAVAMTNKTTRALAEAFQQIILFYKAYHYTVQHVTTDSESTLKALRGFFNDNGIKLSHTPAGLHEKRVERAIQTIKNRRRAILAGLPYELPQELETESYLQTISLINQNTNTNTTPLTPYQIVMGIKPTIPLFSFGQVGLFQGRRQDSPDMRAEWGIFVGYGSGTRNFRAYIPHRHGIFSKRKFIPHPTVPAEWNFRARIRGPDPRVTSTNTSSFTPSPPPPAEPPPTLTLPTEPLGTTTLRLSPPTNADFQQMDSNEHIQPRIMTTPSPTGLNNQEGEPRRNIHRAPTLDREGESGNNPMITRRYLLRSSSNAQGGAVNVEQQPVNPRPPAEPPPPLQQQQAITPQSPTTVTNSGRPRREATKHAGWRDGRYDVNYSSISQYHVNNEEDIAYRVSMKAAYKMKDRIKDINQAAEEEIRNIMKNKVASPINKESIPRSQWKEIVPSHMFFKFKYKADGSFDKVKARLVANGNLQHPDTIMDTYAPTVSPISVLTILNLAANRGSTIAAYDIKGAFLLTPIEDGRFMAIKIPKSVAIIWIAIKPEHTKYLTSEGELILKLNKYIYGLAESPHQFNQLLNDVLIKEGFKVTKADQCVYTKMTTIGPIMITAHVDDMLVVTPNTRIRDSIYRRLSKHFDLVSQTDQEHLSYLGLNITYNQGTRQIKLTQTGFIKDLLKKYNAEGISRPPRVPATQQILMDCKEGSEIADRKQYLSMIMTMMYLARFTRPDILFAVTVLATHSANPTNHLIAQAMKVVKYLAGTRDVGLHIDGRRPIQPRIYADASHALHSTGHGQGGIMITLGSSPIYCRSYKLKNITRSSSESELVTLEEASTYAVWLKHLLQELDQTLEIKAIPIYQDNLSTIIIANTGPQSFKRTKHLLVKESYVKERIAEGDVKLKYLPTEDMPADCLTKPLSKPKLDKCLSIINVRNA